MSNYNTKQEKYKRCVYKYNNLFSMFKLKGFYIKDNSNNISEVLCDIELTEKKNIDDTFDYEELLLYNQLFNLKIDISHLKK